VDDKEGLFADIMILAVPEIGDTHSVVHPGALVKCFDYIEDVTYT